MIDIIKTTKERKEFKDAHNDKAATVLGVIQIIVVLFELITYVDMILELRLELESALPLLLICVFFLVSGGLAIAGARRGTKCLIVATRVTSIISAVLAYDLCRIVTVTLPLGLRDPSTHTFSESS